MVIYGNSCLTKKKKGTTTMKAYIKPNTTIVDIELQDQLLTISGNKGEQQLQGGSNGEYTDGVNLGSRRTSVWGDDEEYEY